MIGDMPVPRKVRKSLAVLVTVIFILTQTLAGTALAMVYNLHPTAITDTTADLQWSFDSADSTAGLFYSPQGLESWLPANTTAPLTSASTSASVYGLAPGTEYDFKVTADPFSYDYASLITSPNGGGAIAVNLNSYTVTMNTATTVDESFYMGITNAIVKELVGSSDLIFNNLPPGLTASAQKGEGNNIQITIAGTASPPVNNTVPLEIVVKSSAVINGGMSNSTPAIVNINPAGPTWNPGSLSSSDVTTSSVTLSWPSAQDNVEVTAFKITYNSTDVNVAGSIYSQNITGLTANTEYHFDVRAGDAENNWSSPLSINVTTLSDQLPSPIWRFNEGEVPPSDPGAFHPFDYNESTNSLTLYWKKVYDGQSPVSTYKIYRAPDSSANWNDPASWGTEILTISEPNTTVLGSYNEASFLAFSNNALLSGTNPGTVYRFGIRAVNGVKMSGISNIPYPFRTPGDSLLGIAGFKLLPDHFTEGKYALGISFTRPVDVDKAVDITKYAVTLDGMPVTLSGPDGGKGYFNSYRNAVEIGTNISLGTSGLVRITATGITDPENNPMNTNPGQGPYNEFSGQISDNIVNESGGETEGAVMAIDPLGGRTSEYLFAFQAREAIPYPGGQIKITFPSEYSLNNLISAPNTSLRPFDPNGDINMDGAGVVTISSVTVNTNTREVALTLSGPVAAQDFLVFVLDNITNPNPSQDGQAYMINVKAPGTSVKSMLLPTYIKKAGAVTVTVNNLPSEAEAVVFAITPDFYSETSVSSPSTGTSRQFTLMVPIPGEYNIGVRPASGSGFASPPKKLVNVTGNTSVTINIQESAAVTFELKDDQGGVPANGSIYANAPSNPDVTGIKGQVDPVTGRVTLKLKTGVGYIVGGDAPGMPSAAERKIYVDTGGNVFVDGGTTPVSLVSLIIKKPARTISGTIKYSGGLTPLIGAPVVARSNKYPAGTPPVFTDNNGRYSLFVPQDIWTVEVFVPEMGTRVVTSSANTISSASVTADLTLPALASFAKVTGIVTQGGNPLQGAMVWAEASNKEYLNGVVTGPDGRYTLQFDNSKSSGATIHCSSPEFGELAPQAYAATVNFSVSTGTLNITFGRGVTGTASIYQSGASARRVGGEMKNSGSISLKAPNGVYTVEVYINEIGRITRQNIAVPGTLDLTAEVAAATTINLNVAVTNGGSEAWVNVIGIEQGKTIAQGKRTSGGAATFTVPQNTEVSVSVRRDGYFPSKQDVRLGAANTTLNFTLVAEEIDNAVTVTLTGSEDATGKSEYYVWAKEISTGSVVKSKSTLPNGIVVKLPSAGSWVFKASTEGYFSDEVTLSVSGAGTLSLPLSNAVETKTATAVVKSNQGGTVSSQDVGVKLVIPANALGNNNTNASITTSSTLAVTETSSAKPMGSARDITITDSEGKITTLSHSIEIVLDYHSDYLTWPADQRDQMALQMQLAYWDAEVDDWVIIPATNDIVNHTIRGFVDHLTKFAVVYPQTLVIRGMAAAQPTQTTSSGSSSLGAEISQSALSGALENARNTGKVVLQAVSQDKLAFTLEQFKSIEAAAKPVETRMTGATLSFAPEVLKASGLDLSKVASFTLEALRAGEDTARELAARSKNANLYSLKGSVFQLSVRVKMEDNSNQELKQFNGKITVSLPVPTESRSTAAKGGLYAGRFNEVTGQWDTVPGTYDAASGTYCFETDRFSQWGLLEKVVLQLKTFSDISDHWARKDIEYMAGNGYISGMGGGLYSPDASVTRAQFATMLVNVLKLDGIADIPFGDVRPGEWYYFSVGRAYTAGLVKGTGPNMFAPEDLITREQMSAMICNALKYKGLLAEVSDPEEVLKGFSDRPSISGWARKSSAQAVKHQILRGKPSGGQIYFAPADKATRAEAAVMLKNLVGQLK